MAKKVTESFKQQHDQMYRTLAGTGGGGSSNVPGQGIAIPPRRNDRWTPQFDQPDDFFGWCSVDGSAQVEAEEEGDDPPKQWVYTLHKFRKLKPGYEDTGWDDPLALTSNQVTAYNTYETRNGATGLMGNGVTLNADGVVEGTQKTIGPIQFESGPYRVYRVVCEEDGSLEYWFSEPNPLIGECE